MSRGFSVGADGNVEHLLKRSDRNLRCITYRSLNLLWLRSAVIEDRKNIIYAHNNEGSATASNYLLHFSKILYAHQFRHLQVGGNFL